MQITRIQSHGCSYTTGRFRAFGFLTNEDGFTADFEYFPGEQRIELEYTNLEPDHHSELEAALLAKVLED